ncbi:shikimate dehydrogenase [Plectonema cf. radiosum LEGE 06105]|uniref:Shikimate dehydrogenase (NADP(+)) n=1 Tax=Plectonema cf. radiosum LEGE 06105 TaxID=945769 RepID=A0A8J7JWQ1_9CYAN|nr:shikimate dehydrogenase [Plectonema radiosum]MBE9215875.1 shikimate dehydrogenase [Plectonema cf. radiosum LEGE 06105]
MITGTTKLLGVIGHPVEHSLSPLMHNAALAKLGLNYVYLPFPIEPQNLAKALDGFAAIGVVGFNATIPHKQAIIPLLSEIEPIAQAVGAVNTVVRKNHRWIGTNTDVEGFIAPLQLLDRDWSQTVAVVLGNGGAARAVVAGCTQLGCASVDVVGRNLQKLEEFRDSWQDSPLVVNLQIHQWDALPKIIDQANLLINTTPIGMYPQIENSPLEPALFAHLPKGAIVYDLIYTPSPTKFLQYAQTTGVIAIDGLEMLVQQGAAALKIWLQRETVPVDVMRQTLQQQLYQK